MNIRKYLIEILFKTLIGHLVPAVIMMYLFDVTEGLGGFYLAILSGWFLFFVLPTLILFVNHYLRSRGKQFEYTSTGIKYFNGREWEEIDFKDIECLVLNLSPLTYDDRINFTFYDIYFFSSIIRKSKKDPVHISCLIGDKMADHFPKSLVKRKRNPFPILPK